MMWFEATQACGQQPGGGVSPSRILIVNPFGIGDVLFTTPLVRALRQAFPASHIGYLCNRRTECVLRDNPRLNELLVYEKDEVDRLFKRSWWQGVRYVGRLLWRVTTTRYEYVVDLSLSERYSFILKVLRVPRRVGFDFRRRGRFLTGRLPIDGYQSDHVVEHYRRLLLFLGIRLLEESLELPLSDEDAAWSERYVQERGLRDAPLLVGIVPAGGVSWGIDAPFRRWSLEGFAAVADALIERHGARVMLFGEATDAPICRKVAQLMKHPVVDASGQTTLGQFISLLSRLSLVVCNDGGPLHLAVSQHVKTVSIFGPVDPAVYGPYPLRRQEHRVVCRKDLPCRPCYHQFKLPPCPYERACLTTITADDVLAPCEAILASSRSAGEPISRY